MQKLFLIAAIIFSMMLPTVEAEEAVETIEPIEAVETIEPIEAVETSEPIEAVETIENLPSRAEHYAQIFSGGSFYVEYEDNFVKKIIAEEGGRRMARTALSGSQAAAVSILNPIAGLFGGGSQKYPEFMFSNGRYYKFAEKDVAFMLEQEHLYDDNLNPREGWMTINKSLSLPDELAVFYWNDPFHRVSEAIEAPIFVESLIKELDGQQCDCDRYESVVKNRADARVVFYIFYKDGELTAAQSAIAVGDREFEVNRLSIKKVGAELDKHDFKVDPKAKVFAAGVGDMNDLLESPVLIGRLEEVDQ